MPQNTVSPPIRTVFARRLKALRVPRGFPTARSFATALEIDENRYTRYERAEVEPDLDLLVKICSILDVSLGELLEMAPPKSASGVFFEHADPAFAPLLAGASHEASRRPALAWDLAELINKFDVTPSLHALETVKRVAKLFGEINADPFGFVSRMTTDPRLEALDTATAAHLGQVTEQLISTTRDELLRSKG